MLPIILRTLLYHTVIFGPMGEEVTGAGENFILWTFTSCQLLNLQAFMMQIMTEMSHQF